VIHNLLIRNINVLLTAKMKGERFLLKKYNSGLGNSNFAIFFIDYGSNILSDDRSRSGELGKEGQPLYCYFF